MHNVHRRLLSIVYTYSIWGILYNAHYLGVTIVFTKACAGFTIIPASIYPKLQLDCIHCTSIIMHILFRYNGWHMFYL